MRRAPLLLLALLAMPAAAQYGEPPPPPVAIEPAIQSVTYAEGRVVRLTAAPGYQLTIEISPDETIETIAIGDSAAWQAAPNRRGDRIFIKPLQYGVTTNMIVVTGTRTYLFELATSSHGGADATQIVRFAYPEPAAVSTPPDEQRVDQGLYRLTGKRELFPLAISEDGRRTYMQWSADGLLPAVYIVDELGQEKLVDAMMRDGILTIDEVVPRLIFRLDGKLARAVRRSEARAK
ncbi:MAG TPA: TrbG/VirB9 family P-type conjugative transfer protein [Sphingopyxis sp.]|mgnify:CR=1 FL=1|nr:TrbG/VirB9 family P-type conjugative transfer protein [Sphingopyxis sp.]HMP45224.1 TrbG/VirB9 family P-type conjugative transfer protein [Sphingopyxis sp.]HMQ18765.1 TrbG/VirB9 family P-type conjugative transfer protein [Sphingopyxis sp.]